MLWLALLVLGCAVVDLVARPSVPRVVAEVAGSGSVVLFGLLAGQTDLRGLAALVIIAVLVLLWSRTVARAMSGGQAALPLAILGGGVLLTLISSPLAAPVAGAWAQWWASLAWPLAHGVDPGRALLVLALLLAQLSTGNVVVRLVLAATGTVNPVPPGQGDPADPSLELKGGRLLGPMERLLILGLGLAGNLTAASIVVAAKGLLRFPELSSREGKTQVHRLTEYFLVGSFVSWILALGSLALLAR